MTRQRSIARLPGRTARQPAIGQIKSAKQTKPASSPDHLNIDDAGGYTLAPPRRKQPIAQPLAPGYIWNGLTQQLIPILPEDHPDYRQNQEVIIEATRRWNKEK
jgi:hypothetical protein